MPPFDDELLSAAEDLITRAPGARGRLPSARIRRSISTSYYALFHFLLDEAGLRLVGAENDLRPRRRILARAFSHKGIRTALDKVRGENVDVSVQEFLRGPDDAADGPVRSPMFVRSTAIAFLDAQAKRHDADYDLNKALSEADARLLHASIKEVVGRAAQSPADRDIKHAMCMLMLLKGKLRSED
jgi:hypothetical protein